MNRSLVFIFVVASVFFLSCIRIDEPGTSSEDINFGVDGIDLSVVATKSSTGTAVVSSLSSFKVMATNGEASNEAGAAWSNVTFSGSSDYTGGKKWPAADPHYNFYASNVDMVYASGGSYVSAYNTTDVVCAYLPYGDVTYKGKNTLLFHHVFARLGNVNVIQEDGFVVSDLTVSIVPGVSGRYNMRIGAGADDGSAWTNVILGSSVVIANGIGSNMNDIWLVPGRYVITASWTASQSGGSSISYVDKTVEIEIRSNKVNIVNISLGGEAVFGVDIVPFENSVSDMAFSLSQSASYGRFTEKSEAKTVVLKGFAGDWNIDYSVDNGATYSGTAPSGLTVERVSVSGGRQDFSISLGDAVSLGSVSLGFSWPSDVLHNNLLGTSASPVDLSLVDIHGDAMQSRECANTYVIHAPGTYMIPLVYGNAVSDGVENTGAYHTSNTGSYILSTFLNAYDTGISSPYIDVDCVANSHSVSTAGLLWSEVNGMVSVESALRSLNGMKYLVFSVDASCIAYGNALVCVRDEQDTVVWSWNIWVTADGLFDVDVDAFAYSEAQKFLNLPIGTVPGNRTVSRYGSLNCIVRFSTGNEELYYVVNRPEINVITDVSSNFTSSYFQFGRPSALPRSNVSGFSITEVQASLGTAISHPDVFYAFTGNWCTTNSSYMYNIWNMSQTAADQNINVVKTVYDPSPVGYHLPKRDAFRSFTSTGTNTTTAAEFNVLDFNHDSCITSADFRRGWFFRRYVSDTVGWFLPAAGYRYYLSGGVSNVGGGGYCWSSCAGSAAGGRFLYFFSGGVYPLSASYRALGFSVVCVLQD